ncbi:MAG: TetR/AcrR family transcriptional regulator [Treponema sp.]|nr:TetR/AcrR family transcriptional regulator [Treponema sp.]
MNRRDKQKAETLTDILRSAEELFMEQGFEKTSMRQIAEHSGLSKGALYHHFDSKEELLERICAEHNRALNNAALPVVEDAALTCIERMRRIFTLSRNMSISDISLVSEYLKLNHNENSLVLREKLEKYNKQFYVTVMGPLLNEARRKGECNFTAAAGIIAVFIHQLNRAVNEELNAVFERASSSDKQKHIIEIMKSYVYVLSKMLNISFETTAYLIGLEESIQLYAQILQARTKACGT